MKKRAFIYKFGCQLNFADAEKIMGILKNMGYEEAETAETADTIFLCTCAVRESAENKVYGMIGELKQRKLREPWLKIVLCGCMGNEQTTVDRLKQSFPYVDLVFGTGSISKLPEMMKSLETHKRVVAPIDEYLPDLEAAEPVRASSFRAFVPVMYGCNNFCTYCIVPHTRGRERSRRPEEIICEVKSLVSRGYKEIYLLGQNVNSYGRGLEEEISFAELLRRLDAIDGDFWIRFTSSHPKDATRELMELVMADNKIEPHFHLPLQSGSSSVLKRMNRHYTREKYMEQVKFLKTAGEEFSITSDMIVGFPNETEEEFEETLEAVREVKYDNIFSFIYSKRSGTRAAEIDDKVSYEEKSQRIQRLLALQREITTEHYKRFLGKTYKVLVDGPSKKGLPLMVGKTHAGIIVEFPGEESMTGKFVNIKITDSANWAIKGRVVD